MKARAGFPRGPYLDLCALGHAGQKGCRLEQHRAAVGFVDLVPGAVHLRQAWIGREPVAVAVEKLPVQQVGRAGFWPAAVLHLMVAGVAVV